MSKQWQVKKVLETKLDANYMPIVRCTLASETRGLLVAGTVLYDRPCPHPSPLTDREHTYLEAVAEGGSVQEIADRIGVTRSTAASMLFRVRKRLGGVTNAHAVAIGIRGGWL